MSLKYVVGFDGSPASKRAADFAIAQAEICGATVVIAHVLEWSPYSFLTPEEVEERHKRRKEELERAETALVKPFLASISGSKVGVETVIKYGHIADTLCEIAKSTKADQMFIGRDGSSAIAARVFGSVAGSIVQTTPVACTIVP